MSGNEILTEQEILEKQADLAKKEESLKKKERELSILEAAIVASKYNLYDKIKVSVKTMDRVISVAIAAIIVCIVLGVIL